MGQSRRRRSTATAVGLALAASLLLHVPAAIWFLRATWLRPPAPASRDPLRVALLDEGGSVPLLDAADAETLAEPEDATPAPEPEAHDGQIVEIAPPEVQERPDNALFLAEYDSKVDRETVDPRFRVERQVTAPTWSPDDAWELADQVELGVDRPSTGGQRGSEPFKKGPFSLFPDLHGRYDGSDRPGLAAPFPSRHAADRFAGSPSNDWLPEIERADRTALNAHEFLFASFWNRVKQLVSFFADQTLANARPSVPLTRMKYELELGGLIALDGSLAAIEVVEGCGVPEFDEAVREAFRLAAPFPDPPAPAAEEDGYIHIRNFGFVITIGTARTELTGIDPRQNVQFPGLQTIPR